MGNEGLSRGDRTPLVLYSAPRSPGPHPPPPTHPPTQPYFFQTLSILSTGVAVSDAFLESLPRLAPSLQHLHLDWAYNVTSAGVGVEWVGGWVIWGGGEGAGAATAEGVGG